MTGKPSTRKLFERDAPQDRAQSDSVCSGLQLADHWQDVAVDWRKGRVYLPQEDLERFGVDEVQRHPHVNLLVGRHALEIHVLDLHLVGMHVDRAQQHLFLLALDGEVQESVE